MKISGKSKIKIYMITFITVSALLLSGCSRVDVGVVVAGSTSVQPYVEILAEEFAKIYHNENGYEIDVQGGGSAAGISAAVSGTADIGMSSRNLTEKEIEKGLWQAEIARDGLAVIVHPDNPVNDLTFEQIRDIYAGAILNWSEVGGWDSKIHLIAREEGSGTRSAFEDLVMGDERITPKAIVQNSNGSVKQLVTNDRNAIGFISLGLVNDKVSAIKLNGVEATHDNIINGNYELYRPFIFISANEPTGAVQVFVDYILSSKGQLILMQKGLISVTEGLSSAEGTASTEGTAS